MGIIDPAQHQQPVIKDELDQELEQIQDKDNLPSKYAGKTLEDVIKMHEEAERKASRLGNELGQVRVQLQRREQEKTIQKKEVKVDDLLENPEEAVTTLVDQHPAVRKLNDLEADLHRREFESSHPDFRKDLENEDFFQWIHSSQIRRALAQAADNHDYVAAKELWDLWSERQELVQSTTAKRESRKQEERAKALKAGTLESGTGSTTESKKVMSRQEIINLKTRAHMGDRNAQAIVEDPTWQREVRAAYMENRVK